MGQEMINSENIGIQQMLQNYLRLRATTVPSNAGAHLDEDSLTAFVEGTLSARENNMFTAHLSGCGFCLHKTAELAQLQAYFEGDERTVETATEAQPARISEVLSGLFSRLFGSFETEQTVFAHEEKKEEENAEESADQDENKKD